MIKIKITFWKVHLVATVFTQDNPCKISQSTTTLWSLKISDHWVRSRNSLYMAGIEISCRKCRERKLVIKTHKSVQCHPEKRCINVVSPDLQRQCSSFVRTQNSSHATSKISLRKYILNIPNRWLICMRVLKIVWQRLRRMTVDRMNIPLFGRQAKSTSTIHSKWGMRPRGRHEDV